MQDITLWSTIPDLLAYVIPRSILLTAAVCTPLYYWICNDDC